MKLREARRTLELHLKKHVLDSSEEIFASRNRSDDSYFCQKYEIAKQESYGDFWKFTLGDQAYRAGFGHEEIGGPPIWLVDKERGYCINRLFVDDIFLYKEYILKYKIYNSKQFYLNIGEFKVTKDLSRSSTLWYLSNVLDEYSFLSHLKFTSTEKNIDKILLLLQYEKLKKYTQITNREFIEKYLSKIPFNQYESDTEWQLTKRIFHLNPEEKLKLHQKFWTEYLKEKL